MKRVSMSFNPPVPLAKLYELHGSVEIPGQEFAAVKNPIPNKDGEGQVTGQFFLYHEKTNTYAPIDQPIPGFKLDADQFIAKLGDAGVIEELNARGYWLVLRDDVVQVYYSLAEPSLAVGMSYFTYIPASAQLPNSPDAPEIEISDDGGFYVKSAEKTTTSGYPYGGVSGVPTVLHQLPVAPYQQPYGFYPQNGYSPVGWATHGFQYTSNFSGMYGMGYGLGSGHALGAPPSPTPVSTAIPPPASNKTPEGTYVGSWQMILDSVVAGGTIMAGAAVAAGGFMILPVVLVVAGLAYAVYRIASTWGTTISAKVEDVGNGLEQGYKKQSLNPNASVPKTIAWYLGRTTRLMEDALKAGMDGVKAALQTIQSMTDWLKKYGTRLLIGFGAITAVGLGFAVYVRMKSAQRRR
jgi:hypothetical protein